MLVVDGTRIIVPRQPGRDLLETLHVPHLGADLTLKNAEELYFWPEMREEVVMLVARCEKCQKYRPSLPKEPFLGTTASEPMEHVDVDLIEVASAHWLFMVDQYSSFIILQRLRRLATGDVVAVLSGWFLDFGYPSRLRADGGPQVPAEFREFCCSRSIEFQQSSPFNSLSNGKAESGVKIAKYLVLKCGGGPELWDALSEQRNSPKRNAPSPARLFFGRQQWGLLPQLLVPLCNPVTAGRGQILRPLEVGAAVWVQNPTTKRWDIRGTIMDTTSSRTCVIRMQNGAVLPRNRRFLRPCGADPAPEPTLGVINRELQKAKFPIVSNFACNKVWSGKIREEIQICGGGPKTDSCKGDSGGPLVMENKSGQYGLRE
eukprot:snap_masked-scaffold1126_size61158-processed-gene-0.4 protein:Tk03415 transcript:snap_masked-scaffold1126_size61158-processed-gene-0.4-mRNA-1 annotation:"PREDICTED: uncharacterized protein K02A2.6-like"